MKSLVITAYISFPMQDGETEEQALDRFENEMSEIYDCDVHDYEVWESVKEV